MAEFISTDAASLGGTAGGAGVVQKAYDRLLEFELRSEPMFRAMVDKRPARQSTPGLTVGLQIWKDKEATTATLDETVDPDSTGLDTPDIVNITLAERGDVVTKTRLLSLASLADVDPAVANIVAFHMRDSLDAVVQNVLLSGTNVLYGSGGTTTPGATNAVTAADTLTAADIRKAVAKLRTNNAPGRKGNLYWAAIHPEVSHDLRAESDAAAWRMPHTYQDTANLYAGEIGAFEGAFFVESPRCKVAADGTEGASVYRTYIAGKQALAEVVGQEPKTVIGPVVDKLGRFRHIGWYGVLGHSIYRNECLYRIESGSSIAD